MNIRTQAWSLAICVALLAAFAATSQAAIVDASFQSIGSRQNLAGTTIGLAENQPGGTWAVGAGWDWGNPYVSATWDPPGLAADLVNLTEEDTALGITIASSGGYLKPSALNIAGSIQFGDRTAPNTAGLGFWSTMPLRANGGGASSLDGFTGLILHESNETLQVYAGGALVGSAVSVGTIDPGVFYEVSNEIDTSSGALSNVMFDGSAVSGLSSTAFLDSATAYAGVLTGDNSRALLNSFVVSESAAPVVPEPSSLILLGLGVLLLPWRRTCRDGRAT